MDCVMFVLCLEYHLRKECLNNYNFHFLCAKKYHEAIAKNALEFWFNLFDIRIYVRIYSGCPLNKGYQVNQVSKLRTYYKNIWTSIRLWSNQKIPHNILQRVGMILLFAVYIHGLFYWYILRLLYFVKHLYKYQHSNKNEITMLKPTCTKHSYAL